MTNIRFHLGIGLAAFSLALAGCGGGGSGPSDPRIPVDSTPDSNVGGDSETFCSSDATTFEVVAFTPADGASNVAPNSAVRVEFNFNVDASSVDMSSLALTSPSTGTAPNVSYSTVANTVVIRPDANLIENTDYRITANTGLRAICAGDDSTKALADAAESSFTTGDAANNDNTAPSVTASSPENGETLVATDGDIMVEFSEAVDPASVRPSSFSVTTFDPATSTRGEAVSGAVSVRGNTIVFDPEDNLQGQTYYSVNITSGITDLAGNGVDPETEVTFRSGGLVVLLNDSVVSQIPGLGEGLNQIGGMLLEPLAFGNADDGLSSLDNALLLQIPLVDGLASLADNAGSGGFTPDFETVNGVDFAEFSSALVSVCDPQSANPSAGGVNCTAALDLGLDATQLQALADNFAGGDVEQVPALIQGLAATFASGDFANIPSELASLLGNELFPTNDGLGVELRLVDDNGLPLPTQAKDALQQALDAINQIPVLGTLVDQNDAASLVDIGLLEGSLIQLNLGGLVELGVLQGTEEPLGENGALNLGGALFDLLLGFADQFPGEGGGSPLPVESLPVLGDILSALGQGDFEAIQPDPELLTGLADMIGLGDLPDGEFLQTLPLVGEILSALDPETLDPNNLPVIGELINELTSALTNGPEGLEELPLLSDVVAMLEGGQFGDNALLDGLRSLFGAVTDNEAANTLQELPLIGGILAMLTGAF